MKKLSGKIALVTGASGGIGRSTAIALAQLGAKVAINYLTDKEKAQDTAAQIKKLGGISFIFQADVGADTEVKKMISDISKKMGDITLLVHNASPDFVLKALEDSPWESFEKYLAVYVRGAYNLIRAALPGMKKKGYGKIVTVLSSFILQNLPKKAAAYVTAKEALWGLTRAAAADLASLGIRVNAVSPGLTDTESIQRSFPPHYKELVASRSLQGKINSPEDVAERICYLLSPESDHLNGVNIPIGVNFDS
jgi:3-oxoacyl-[acyl-carrier protein] reductase